MADKFNGFSQDEINRVSGRKHNKKVIENTMRPASFRGHGGTGIRRVLDKSENSRQQKMPADNIADKIQKMDQNHLMEEVNLDSSMSKSIEEALFYQPLKKSLPTETSAAATNTKTTSTTSHNKNQPNSSNDLDSQNSTTQQNSDDSSILKLSLADDDQITSTCSSNSINDDSSILPSSVDRKTPTPFVPPSSLNVQSPFRGISLKDFETHRKMIEEQNRQKKDLLYKVIEQHSQKTAAETRKIEEIKAELSKLDNDLAIDVAVLRKQIETACIHFSNIEKNYLKIEAQFLKSKIELHNAAEKKELLTEHLCTVIAHNEDRKAQKLTELMEKVGLAANNNENYEPPSSTSN